MSAATYVLRLQNGRHVTVDGTRDGRALTFARYVDAFNARAAHARANGQFASVVEL